MRILFILLAAISFLSCNNDRKDSLPLQQDVKKQQDKLEGTVADYLINLKLSELSRTESDTIKKVNNWRELPSLEPNLDPSFERKILGSYNSPYPEDFDLIILGIYEGGDCGPFYFLASVKDSFEFDRAIVVKECAWEIDNSDMIAVFDSDTSFTTILKAAGVAQDSTGYLTGKTARRILKTSYIIKSDGMIQPIDTSDQSWITEEQYEHKF
jgi:hypothetical protein